MIFFHWTRQARECKRQLEVRRFRLEGALEDLRRRTLENERLEAQATTMRGEGEALRELADARGLESAGLREKLERYSLPAAVPVVLDSVRALAVIPSSADSVSWCPGVENNGACIGIADSRKHFPDFPVLKCSDPLPRLGMTAKSCRCSLTSTVLAITCLVWDCCRVLSALCMRPSACRRKT